MCKEMMKNKSAEEIICAPNTKIGKFFSSYDKCQISLEQGIAMLKEDDELIGILRIIADVETRKNYFKLSTFELNHAKRVLFIANMIMNMRKDLNPIERTCIFRAIEYHNIGKLHEFKDEDHGKRAVEKITSHLDAFNIREQKVIKFLIEEHCKSTTINKLNLALLDISEEEKEKYGLYLNYLKDAIRLDRVRFPEILSGMEEPLDPTRLRLEESKQLIKFACELLEKFDSLFNTDEGDSAENFLKNPLVFYENKIQAQKEYIRFSEKSDFLQSAGEIKVSKPNTTTTSTGTNFGSSSGFYLSTGDDDER